MHTNKPSCFTALTAPVVAITTAGAPTAGGEFTLTCTVTVVKGLVVQPTVEWVDAGNMIVMSDEDGITVRTVDNALDLMFNPLLTSHGGQYTCRATINIESINITNLQNGRSQNVIVTSEYGCYFGNNVIFSFPLLQFPHHQLRSLPVRLAPSLLALFLHSPASQH